MRASVRLVDAKLLHLQLHLRLLRQVLPPWTGFSGLVSNDPGAAGPIGCVDILTCWLLETSIMLLHACIYVQADCTQQMIYVIIATSVHFGDYYGFS